MSHRSGDGSVEVDDPHVAEANGVAVILKLGYQSFGTFLLAGSRLSFEFKLVVDLHSIMPDGDHSVFGFLSLRVEPSRLKLNLISLPTERGQTHVDIGLLISIQRTAVIEFQIESERIENLNLVPALQITTAVAASLSSRIGHVR